MMFHRKPTLGVVFELLSWHPQNQRHAENLFSCFLSYFLGIPETFFQGFFWVRFSAKVFGAIWEGRTFTMVRHWKDVEAQKKSPPDRLQKHCQCYPMMLWQKLTTWFGHEHVRECCHAFYLLVSARVGTIDFKINFQNNTVPSGDIQGPETQDFGMSACVFDEGNKNDNQSFWKHNKL